VEERHRPSEVRKLGRTRHQVTDAGPVLVEERATLLTQLLVGRVLLTDGGKESHSTLVREEVQEPHEFPLQATGD